MSVPVRESIVLMHAPSVRVSVRRAIKILGAEQGLLTSAMVTRLLETHPDVMSKLTTLPPETA